MKLWDDETDRTGNGVEQSIEDAVIWYARAGDAGSLQARTQLAELYFRGDEVPRDVERARDLWRSVVEAGNAPGADDSARREAIAAEAALAKAQGAR